MNLELLPERSTNKEPRRIHSRWVEIPSEVSIGMQVLDAVVMELNLAGFSPRQIGVIELAYTEALTNAIRHGNQDDPHKLVLIEYSIEPDGILLTIQDEGCGFCQEDVDDPTLPEHRNRPGGRGLLLIRSLAESVLLNERGNRIQMRLPKFGRAA